MLPLLVRYYTEQAAIIALLMIAIRITFKLGALLDQFTQNCVQSQATHERIDADIRELRARRK